MILRAGQARSRQMELQRAGALTTNGWPSMDRKLQPGKMASEASPLKSVMVPSEGPRPSQR